MAAHRVRHRTAGERSVDDILECWFAAREAATAAIGRAAAIVARARAVALDRSFLLQAEEFGEMRLRSLYQPNQIADGDRP